MQVDIAMQALRSVSIDVANLTSRLALSEAAAQTLVMLSTRIDTSTWNRHAEGEDYSVAIPGDQMEALDAILDVIEHMR